MIFVDFFDGIPYPVQIILEVIQRFGPLVGIDLIGEVFQLISDSPYGEVEMLQNTRVPKLVPNALVIVMGGHTLLKQINDIRENQDQRPPDFGGVADGFLASKELLAYVVLVLADNNLLLD